MKLMKDFYLINEANGMTFARLFSVYLSAPNDGETVAVSTIEDVCVTGRVVGNRYGVPSDATTVRYLIEHPDQQWSVAVRAVWRGDALMSPTATHTVIEMYYDDSDRDDDVAVKIAVTDWLKSLPL